MRIVFLFAVLSTFIHAEILVTHHIEEIVPLIDEKTWILVDLDNCMFEAKEAVGHADWFYDQMQQYLESGMAREEAIRSAYPRWIETQRTCDVKPMEENFIPILSQFQEKGVVIIGLTHRQPCIVDSTIRQVSSLGFDFTKTAPSSREELTLFSNGPALYSQGILFVGDYNKKTDIFQLFLSRINKKIEKILFINDKLKNVEELEILNSLGIGYQGIHYTAIQHVQPVYVREIAEFEYHFEALAKAEKWDEIMALGTAALKVAQRETDESKICARLTSTSFYQGNYEKALEYVRRCHELSESFEDPSLFLRALYLESAVYRALAGIHSDERLFSQAVKTAEEAAELFEKKQLQCSNLKGKIYFNLGAAHADNPQGDLQKAVICYSVALESFQDAQAVDDQIRTSIRLGKVHLLQKNFGAAQRILDEIRPLIPNKRIAMQTNYLEAQVKLTLKDFVCAERLIQDGLAIAEALGAKEDRCRFERLLKELDE